MLVGVAAMGDQEPVVRVVDAATGRVLFHAYRDEVEFGRRIGERLAELIAEAAAREDES